MERAVQKLTERLDRLLGRVRSFEPQMPEDSGLIGLVSDYAPRITRLLEEGIELLQEIEELYDKSVDDEASESDTSSLVGIGILISLEFAAREVADLAYFAVSDLKSAANELRSVRQRKNLLALASTCEGSLRRLGRALISLESAVYEYEGQEPPQRLMADLQLALQIRQLYARLRREVLYHEEESIAHRLQVIANRLAGIREQRIYPLLRFDDRVQLRAILQRIGRWLTEPEPDPEEGTHIWEDLAGAVHLLANVTEREEVRDHDYAVLERAHSTLFESRQPPHHLPEDLRYELHTLMGLDDDLDDLLLGADESPLSAWQSVIARLWKETERRTTGDRPYDAWPLG